MENEDQSMENATQLSIALYTAGIRMVRIHRPFLEPLGLTFPQYLVFVELLAESPRTVGDLGARLEMDAGTITPLLKRLEAAGKVTRTRDLADERRVLINLTPDGEALRAGVLAVTGQVAKACQEPAPNLDLDALRGMLELLAHPEL